MPCTFAKVIFELKHHYHTDSKKTAVNEVLTIITVMVMMITVMITMLKRTMMMKIIMMVRMVISTMVKIFMITTNTKAVTRIMSVTIVTKI